MFTYITGELKNLKEKFDIKTADVIAVRKDKNGENPIFRELESERKHTNFIRIIPASLALLVVELGGMLWAVWSHVKFDYGKGFFISSCVFFIVSLLFVSWIENGLKKSFLTDRTKKITYSFYWILYMMEAMSFSIMEYLDRGQMNNYITFIIVFTLLPIIEPIPKILIYVVAMGVEIHTMIYENAQDIPINIGEAVVCIALTVTGIVFSFLRFYFYISDALTKKNYQYSANGDPLTGLMNRRGFGVSVPSLRDFCINNEYNFCVIMFDIDDFKKFNDTYGHLKGDICLKAVSECIRKSFSRPTDLCVRYGGEEFVVVTAQHDTERLVEHLCQITEQISQIKIDDVKEPVTTSVGFFTCKDKGEKPTEYFLEKADEQLYNAKTNGKNCVSFEGRLYK